MATPRTILGNKLAGGALVAPPVSSVSATKLSRRIVAGRRGELVDLLALGRVFLELPGAVAWLEIEEQHRKAMGALFGELTIENAPLYELDHARRILAVAARDPDDRALAFGTIEEWGELDVDVINEAWQAFGDIRERLDPISQDLTSDDMVSISSAVKKKDAALLRTFGVAKLSAWLASMVDQPSTSQTPSSPNSDSQSERSE